MMVLDLFSGIGGFSLGLERAGMTTVAFCEIEPYAQRVLRKHWPDVPIFDDIRTLRGDDVGQVDLICGGFPCQDISVAGLKAGLAGARSGLWKEYARLVCEIGPRIVIVENVAAILDRGMGDVLRDLAEIGYDAEWCVLSASFVGAPHARDRMWLVAYPIGAGLEGYKSIWGSVCGEPRSSSTKFGNRVVSVGAGWPRLSNYLRMGNELSRPVDRLRGLGNSVVPQVVEQIGRAIMQATP